MEVLGWQGAGVKGYGCLKPRSTEGCFVPKAATPLFRSDQSLNEPRDCSNVVDRTSGGKQLRLATRTLSEIYSSIFNIAMETVWWISTHAYTSLTFLKDELTINFWALYFVLPRVRTASI